MTLPNKNKDSKKSKEFWKQMANDNRLIREIVEKFRGQTVQKAKTILMLVESAITNGTRIGARTVKRTYKTYK